MFLSLILCYVLLTLINRSRNNLVTVVVPLLQAIQRHTGGYYQVFAGWPVNTPEPGKEQAFGVKLYDAFPLFRILSLMVYYLASLLGPKIVFGRPGVSLTRPSSEM